jgi:hypothetical protein
VKLPKPGPKEECPPCNPGMYLNDTKCLFCLKGTFSDGKKRKCCYFEAYWHSSLARQISHLNAETNRSK